MNSKNLPPLQAQEGPGETQAIPNDIARPDGDNAGTFENSGAELPEPPERNPLAQMATNWISPFIRYERTRKALKAGDPVFDYTPNELRARDLMGPWSFNLTESAIAAAPVLFLVKLLNFFWPWNPPIPEGTPPLVATAAAIVPDVQNYFQPLLVPVTLMLISWLCARGSLLPSDSTPQKRRRARYAYLYLDGAYGAVPQLCFSLAIALTIWFSQRKAWTPPIAWAVGAIGLYGWAHTLWVSGHVVPTKLFITNGYSPKAVHFWTRKRNRPQNAAPWSRYGCLFLFGGGLVAWVLAIGSVVLSIKIAYALAALKLRTG